MRELAQSIVCFKFRIGQGTVPYNPKRRILHRWRGEPTYYKLGLTGILLMLRIFHGNKKNVHNDYQAWRRNHPNGFVLSESSKGTFMLHWAQDVREHGAGRGCIHLGGSNNPYGIDHCYTTRRKVCSESVTELANWTATNSYVLNNCSHCNTQSFPFPFSHTPAADPLVSNNFEEMVFASRKLSSDERNKRLVVARRKPARTSLVTSVFQRNPDVVAEVLFRANGICEECKMPAPFMRAGTNDPYLEVHHRIHLADGGDDTVANAIALCPNCHRKAHYG